MGREWPAIDGARELMGIDLVAAERRALELYGNAPHPSGRSQAMSLRIHIRARRGNLDAALALYIQGRKEGHRSRASRSARAEIELAGASVFVLRKEHAEAREAVRRVRELISDPLRVARANRSSGGRRRFRWLCYLDAAAEARLGWISYHEGRWEQAYDRGLNVAEISEHPRIQLAAISILAMVTSARPERSTAVLEMINRTELLLSRKRPKPKADLALLEFYRALALAGVGLSEDAQSILSQVITDLLDIGHNEDARRAQSYLLAIRQSTVLGALQVNTSSQRGKSS